LTRAGGRRRLDKRQRKEPVAGTAHVGSYRSNKKEWIKKS